MMRSLYTGATGMVAQQLNIDVISNNLANVNTTGFKKSRAEFEDLMYQTMKIAGSITDGDNRPACGHPGRHGQCGPTAVHKFFTQGDFQNTGNTLDVAVEGDGFFQVDVNGELMYTRRGLLQAEPGRHRGYGQRLHPATGVCRARGDQKHFHFLHRAYRGPGRSGAGNSGAEIPLYTFINPAGLDARGRNLYTPTEASGAETEGVPGTDNVGTLAQGFLEMSNVEVVDEMVNMIVGQRAYEVNSKAIQTSDSMLGIAVQLKRG